MNASQSAKQCADLFFISKRFLSSSSICLSLERLSFNIRLVFILFIFLSHNRNAQREHRVFTLNRLTKLDEDEEMVFTFIYSGKRSIEKHLTDLTYIRYIIRPVG